MVWNDDLKMIIKKMMQKYVLKYLLNKLFTI